MTSDRRCLGVAVATLLLLACATTTGGIHARMGWSEEQGLRVVDVPPEGPAWSAGLRPGDRIVSVDGEPVRDLTVEETVERLRGPIGSELVLRVEREGEILTLTVARAPYH